MKYEILRNYIFSVISVGGHFQVLSGLSSPAKATERCEFFRTNLGSEGMAPPSQPVAASPPIPSSLFIANNPLLVVSTHINPLLVLVVSTRFKLLLVLLVLCAVALLLFHFTPLSSFVIIRQRLNTRPKQSVFQLNIFCRDLCFCNTTSTVKPLKPSK